MRRQKLQIRLHTFQSGFSLIEVLIAGFVLAIGVLGVASLNLAAMKNNADAINRTQAVIAFWDIADRVRANPGADYSVGFNDDPSSSPNCVTSACTTANQLRDYDLSVWKCMLGRSAYENAGGGPCATLDNSDPVADASVNNAMIYSDGEITRNGDRYTVQIWWFDPNSHPSSSGCNPGDKDLANCFSTLVMEFDI